MSKNFLKSKTIQSAIASLVILCYQTGKDINQNGLQENHLLILLGALGTFISTVEGRAKAKSRIVVGVGDGKEEDVVPLPSPSPSTELTAEPDFVQIEALPSTITPPTEVEVEDVADPLDYVDSNSQEGEIDIFALQADNGKYYIVPTQDSRIKEVNVDSSTLSTEQFGELKKGIKYPILSYKKEGTNSISVSFDSNPNKNYFLYTPHISLFRPDETLVDLSETTPEKINTSKTPILLPGFKSTFYLEDSIYPGSHFTWSEATKNGQRIPVSKTIVLNIIKVAKDLDKLRQFLGNRPMRITSWYRDPVTNSRVGGARNSSHLQGYAVDFYVVGQSIWDTQKRVLDYWRHGGVGKGAPRGFVHCASDNWYRVWNY